MHDTVYKSRSLVPDGQSRWWIKRMINRRKGLGKKDYGGGGGAMEFLELGFDDFRNCKDFKVIVDSVIGDIPS